MQETLKHLQVVKAFTDEGTELDELESTLAWFITHYGEEAIDQILTLDTRALAGKERKKTINTIQKMCEKRAEKLRELIVGILKELDLKSFDGGVYGNITLMDATQPKLTIEDESKIPKKFFNTEIIPEHKVTTLDKDKLKAHLLLEEKIEGASIETTQYIRIGHKVKSIDRDLPPELTPGEAF